VTLTSEDELDRNCSLCCTVGPTNHQHHPKTSTGFQEMGPLPTLRRPESKVNTRSSSPPCSPVWCIPPSCCQDKTRGQFGVLHQAAGSRTRSSTPILNVQAANTARTPGPVGPPTASSTPLCLVQLVHLRNTFPFSSGTRRRNKPVLTAS
jgi:hypothetical protein